MAKLGTITIFAEKESGMHTVEVTKYAVEKGEPFTDHVKKRPSEWTVSGYILRENHKIYLAFLRMMMNEGRVLKYVGKTYASDVVITGISDDYSSNVANGFAITVSLQKVRITRTAWVKIPPKQRPVQKPTTSSGKKKPVEKKPRTSSAVYHLVKKGDTYYAIGKKYGVSVQSLRDLNPWEDRRIPIGVKMLVRK